MVKYSVTIPTTKRSAHTRKLAACFCMLILKTVNFIIIALKSYECGNNESDCIQSKHEDSDGITWCEVCEYDYELEDLNEHTQH